MLFRLDGSLTDRVARPTADRPAHWTTADALGRSLTVEAAVFAGCGDRVRFTEGKQWPWSAAVAGPWCAVVFHMPWAAPPAKNRAAAPIAPPTMEPRLAAAWTEAG